MQIDNQKSSTWVLVVESISNPFRYPSLVNDACTV